MKLFTKNFEKNVLIDYFQCIHHVHFVLILFVLLHCFPVFVAFHPVFMCLFLLHPTSLLLSAQLPISVFACFSVLIYTHTCLLFYPRC